MVMLEANPGEIDLVRVGTNFELVVWRKSQLWSSKQEGKEESFYPLPVDCLQRDK